MADIKRNPEDFVVKEILKVPLQKDGKYRIYLLKKKGLETKEALSKIAKVSQIPKNFISFCGLKDKNALTYQYVAVPKNYLLKPPKDRRISLKFVGYLNFPLKASWIKCNEFSINVFNSKEPPKDRIEVLKSVGLPNYYGEQRFTPVRKGKFFTELLVKGLKEEALLYLFTPAGWEGSKDRKGKKAFLEGNYKEAVLNLKGWRKKLASLLLEGKVSLKEALSLVPQEEIVFQFNVYQSFLFNEYLSSVFKNWKISYLTFKYKVGFMVFPLEKVSLPASLPVFHPRKSYSLYKEILKKRGFKKEDFLPFAELFHFFERKVFVKPEKLKIKSFKYGVNLCFSLPAGSYATNLIRFIYDAV